MKQFLIALAVLIAACTSSRPEPGVEASTHSASMHSNETAPAAPALQPDEFDAAVPVSVAEAAKATKPTNAPGPAEASALYVCPMHPEVTSDKPEKCPKCGMTLVQRARK